MDADSKKRREPDILLTHLIEGIGIAIDFKGDRMFLTDLAGSSIPRSSMGRRRDHYSWHKEISPASPTPKSTQRRIDTSYNKPIRRIAIVGTGVIGASWAAEYLARGFDVVATDPAPNAEANLRRYIDEAWKDLTNIGLSKGASRDRLTFTTDVKEALSNADFVQENGPERPDFKIKLFADMSDATPVDSLIASSSSGITPSILQSKCKHPERILIGHTSNPPHIIPLVEVVGGTKTSPDAIEQALAFYAAIGKKPVYLKKELPGHVGNRLQTALYREVMYLIQQDVLEC